MYNTQFVQNIMLLCNVSDISYNDVIKKQLNKIKQLKKRS